MTLDDPAAICRVTPQAVHGWVKAGMPVVRKGARGRSQKTLIDLQKAIEWYFGENYERLELDRQKTRLTSEQADKTAFENAERSRVLVPLSLIERDFSGLLAE